MPKKPLEEPDDAKYHLEVAGIDEQIEQLQEKFEELKAEQHETRSNMKDG
jgi:cell division protein FtsB